MTITEARPDGAPAHVPPERVFEFDIYADPMLTADLHESYEGLHAKAPDIFYTPKNGGHWIVSRYEDIMDIVRDFENFSVREMQIPRVPIPPVFIPLSLDPPANIPYRQALMPFFSPKAVAAMEPKIRQFARDMIAEVAGNGSCEFVNDISSRFPVSVFMELMGMPLDKLREFRVLADQYFNARTGEEVAAMSGSIVGVMTALIEYRRKNPTGDLISSMINFQIDGRPITLEEMQSATFLLFLGGMDTVTNLSSYLYRYLATDEQLQARLAGDPAVIPAFVEEGLRSFGVVNNPRIVARDCESHGVTFKKDDMVLCLLPMAGRDERRTANPNKFDIDRERHDHLTFSSGPHLCLGHHLARLEIRILTEEWVKQIPSFHLKQGATFHSRYGTVMALESLALEWRV
jgi:cytochrome P450